MNFAVPVEVGFCDGGGHGFLPIQPIDQLERWALPVDNGSHLVINWRPDRRVCGLNVTSYFVGFASTLPLLDAAANIFGGFPQDICSPQSVARQSVAINGEANLPSTCSPYPLGCSALPRTSVVAIPQSLRALARFDVQVSIRAWGSVGPTGNPTAHSTPVTFWCHKYRRAGQQRQQRPAARQRFWRWLRKLWAPRPLAPPAVEQTTMPDTSHRTLLLCLLTALAAIAAAQIKIRYPTARG